MSMEMKIGQISSGDLVLDNVVLNGSAEELIEYMNKIGVFSETRPIGVIPNETKDLESKYSEEDFDKLAEKIDLTSLVVDSKLLKEEDRKALIGCLPSYVKKYKKMDSKKIPPCIMKAYDSVCAYVFNTWDIEKTLEFTVAKYNKILYDRTSPANIICIYRVDGKYVVLLTQYPVRESL